MLDIDTIAAIATAPGNGGVGIVRLSGTDAYRIATTITSSDVLKPRHATYRPFYDDDNALIDDGIALYFPGPNSFTGEDVVELQGHGGAVVNAMLLERCCRLGARLARAGEFSERAFHNGKLDLAQAEAIADLISAQTQVAAKQARASLEGVFSDAVHNLTARIIELRKFVEAAIDFPEEEIDFLSEGSVSRQLRQAIEALESLRKEARQGAIIQHGATIVLAGKPNAGKSSLLNTVAGLDVAIVTDKPGTTRDIVREAINLDGLPINLVDTAGLRDTTDEIEQEGVKRARAMIAEADLVLHVIDDSDPSASEAPHSTAPVLTVYNKIDLSQRPAGLHRHAVGISTKTGAGIPDLKRAMLEKMGIDQQQSRFSARERHLQALTQSQEVLLQAEQQFLASGAGELLAEDLRSAHDILGEITGRMTPDELLGQIFSSFCIGK